MWNSIYDYWVQVFSGLRWSAFLAQNSNNLALANKMRNIFRNDLYSMSAMMILVVVIVVVFFYYFIFNRKGGAGYAFKLRYWLWTWLGTSLFVSTVLMYVSVSMTKSFSSLHPFKYTLSLGLTNFIYTAIFFFAISFIVKRFSVANTTPF